MFCLWINIYHCINWEQFGYLRRIKKSRDEERYERVHRKFGCC